MYCALRDSCDTSMWVFTEAAGGGAQNLSCSVNAVFVYDVYCFQVLYVFSSFCMFV